MIRDVTFGVEGAAVHRYLEALLFGIASLGLLGAGYLLLFLGSSVTGGEGIMWRGFVGLASFVEVAGLAILAFVAGRRRSSIDLLATVAFTLVGPLAWSVAS